MLVRVPFERKSAATQSPEPSTSTLRKLSDFACYDCGMNIINDMGQWASGAEEHTPTGYFEQLRDEIAQHESNAAYKAEGHMPLFVASPHSKIMIVGQAPGIRAQSSNTAWNDASGRRLVEWLGVTEEQFRDPRLFAHIPMDFYYPGKGKSGDLPPRKAFAPLWHDRFRERMSEVQLTILIGKYAQGHYLIDNPYRNLTETVRNYEAFLPAYFPLVHPSPLNFRWFAKNEWFERELVPDLQRRVAEILG